MCICHTYNFSHSNFCVSVHAKAEPLGQQNGRTIARTSFDEAIREFNERGGVSSESEGDD